MKCPAHLIACTSYTHDLASNRSQIRPSRHSRWGLDVEQILPADLFDIAQIAKDRVRPVKQVQWRIILGTVSGQAPGNLLHHEAAMDIPQQLVPPPSRGSGHGMPQSAAGEQSKGAVHQYISKKVAPLTGLTVTSANSFCIIRCTSASVSGSIEEVASSRIRIRLRLVSARISATARQTLV